MRFGPGEQDVSDGRRLGRLEIRVVGREVIGVAARELGEDGDDRRDGLDQLERSVPRDLP